MTEQQLAAFQATLAATHAAAAEVGFPDERYDSGLSVADARVLLGAWLLEKSRADRHEGELSVLRPAVARYAAALESIAWSSNTSSLADVARAALAPQEPPP